VPHMRIFALRVRLGEWVEAVEGVQEGVSGGAGMTPEGRADARAGPERAWIGANVEERGS
jgi:surface antigen